MSVLILSTGNIGPFKVIETLDDRLRCDGGDYPFTVIGSYSISEDDSLAPPPPVPPTPVPESVSPRQIREAMIDTNLNGTALIDAVEAAVAAGDRKLKNWWEFATSFERANPLVIAMAQGLGVTDQQLDDLFILAESL